MTDLSAFPITAKWPPENADAIQLYSFPTPNGIKVSAMLEETGLDYEPHLVRLNGEQKSEEFLSLNPNNKIPAIIDPNGPDGKPLPLFESGAILIYLADKAGAFFGATEPERYHILQWLMFQMGGVGPMFGQFGQYRDAEKTDLGEKDPRTRYTNESRRLMGVLDEALEGKAYLAGDTYSIADIATWPWVRGVRDFYKAGDELGLTESENVTRWLNRCLDRPASQKALTIPSPDG
ncbi:glutathione S-transferase family protein [Notoacmeibacter sp. MSK16QG-6]|uniref:glutathione S-transferase family protein n=1 Tax=Notoacmeibacter sp. MSK16QG-6 TaxID=2957982 RepID=UPI00209DB803|nr:glutathione S-transferase N-terminal domain-containing protein [Notoacmeibacter sp. MSK16QG-6]MCP1198999.1 glutathione S-transferase N-terminal domain-containing protein [Notoacmeibacter sp. MSK16QG-6]